MPETKAKSYVNGSAGIVLRFSNQNKFASPNHGLSAGSRLLEHSLVV